MVNIVIEGVEDASVAADIHNRLLATCGPHTTSLTIAMAPSDTRGRWDLAIQTPDGRHMASFAATHRRLPELAEQHLRRLLERAHWPA